MTTYHQEKNTKLSRKNIFYTLVVGIAFSFGLYGFGITTTTLSIVEAKTYNRDIVDLQTDITHLELEYFQMVNALSSEQIEQFGFSEQKNVYYVSLDENKAVAYNY